MTDTDQASPFAELANRNLHSKRGFDAVLEYLPQLRGRKRAELYREMAHGDALVGAILFAIEMVLRQVDWTVEPANPEGEGPSDSDIERADFLNSCMLDMSHSWEELISDALTMLAFGHSYLEIVYKRRETPDPMAEAERRSRFPDGRIGWRKFSLVPQETITDWDLDEHGGVQAAIQGNVYGSERVAIPIAKAVLFRTDSRTAQGTSVLRNVVQAWYHKKRLEELEGIGAERDLAGLPKFVVDVEILDDPNRSAEYEKIVSNLRVDEQHGLILPGKTNEEGKLEPLADFELISSAGAKQFDTNSLIGRYSREIAMSLLQDVIMLGHERVGTQALASEKRDLSDTALQAWLNGISGVLNTHAVPRLFALNGESLENLPTLEPGELRPTDVAEFAEAMNKLSGAGFVFTGDEDVEAVIRRRLGLPPALPEDQRPEPENKPEPELKPEPEEPEPPAAEELEAPPGSATGPDE